MGGGKGDKALKKVVAASVSAATTSTATLHPKPAAKAAKGSKTPSPTATASAIATTPKAPNPPSPLAALVMGLLALVAAHKATATKGMALALLTALEALAQRFERLLSDGSEPGPQARVVPIAHVDGPVIGLSFRRFGSLGSILLPDGHDPGLIRLHNDIETVLDHHGDEVTEGSEALVAALWGALGLVRRQLQFPKTTLVADCNNGSSVHLRLANAPHARLSEPHIKLIDEIKGALVRLVEARDELSSLRDELDSLEEDIALPVSERTTVVNCRYAIKLLKQGNDLLALLQQHLVMAAAVLHGPDDEPSAASSIDALSRLRSYSPKESGESAYWIEEAASTFARAS